MNIRSKAEACLNIDDIVDLISTFNDTDDQTTFVTYCSDIPSRLACINNDIIINTTFVNSALYLLFLPSILGEGTNPCLYDEKIIEMVKRYIEEVIANRNDEVLGDDLSTNFEIGDIFEIIINEDHLKSQPDKIIGTHQYTPAYYKKRFKSFLNFVIKGTTDVVFDDTVERVIDIITDIGYEKIHNTLSVTRDYDKDFYKYECELPKEDWLLLDEFDSKYFIFESIRNNLIGETSQFISLSKYLKATLCDFYRDNILSLSLYYSKKLNISHNIIQNAVVEAMVGLNTTNYSSKMIAYEMETALLSPSSIDMKDEIDKFIDSIVLECRHESVAEFLSNDEIAIESILNTPFIIGESFDIFYDEAMESSTSGAKKNSTVIQQTQNKIYNAFKTYKNEEDKIDSQLSKAIVGLKNVTVGDSRKAIIEGKSFSPISLLKKALGTVAIFSYSKIGLIAVLITRYAYKKSTSDNERRKLIMELDTEIDIINEKIDDAKGDGNKKAKYSLMRTRNELVNAQRKIKFGIEADRNSLNKAKSMLTRKG